MKRPLALTAYLLATCSLALYTVLYLVGIFRILAWADGFGATTILIFAITAIYAVALALNAASISTFKATPEKYKKKKGTAIAAIVFNFIAIVFLIISLAGLTSEIGAFFALPMFILVNNYAVFIAILVITLLCVLAATVLAIVDLALEKNRVSANQKPAQAEVTEAPAEAPKDNE